MCKKQELCPKCVGAKTIMESNTNGVGFHYEECNLCNGIGTVNPELASDFELSLNEDNFEEDE